MATGHPRGIFNQDPEFITYGTGTRKAADELAKFRASLRASGDIVGGEPRLVSDQTPSQYSWNRYGEDTIFSTGFNQVLLEEDWNNAYLEGRKLGLSDRDAKMVARMRIGQDPTQAVEGRPGVRQAINDTEITDLRRALTAQAAATLDPYIGPDYREQGKFGIQGEVPSVKRTVQQVEAIPPRSAIVLRDKLEARHIPRMPSGRRSAGRFPIELLLAAIASGAGGVVAADAINQPNQELVEVM
tara:strand:- start:86 stop:814 length:729 start_codon:yes stop_codon:yes gene_type:complete